MSVIPCEQNEELQKLILDYAEVLKTDAHKLGAHGLSEEEFYNSGVFRGAIERIRGQFSATMRDKREFCRHVLNYMQDQGFIQDWESAGEANRHDYVVRLKTGRVGVIELKGCLDGNNANIFERPTNAQEFVSALQQTNQPGAAPGAAPAAPAAGASLLGGLGGGGSPIQAIMKALGIEPIPLASPAETIKAVTTESKVFSIYATGYVRSGKRESSVRIHAVVDFRGAPTPQDLISQLLAKAGQGAQGSGGGASTGVQNGITPDPNANLPPGATQGSILSALKPGPGGNIVYYRVD